MGEHDGGERQQEAQMQPRAGDERREARIGGKALSLRQIAGRLLQGTAQQIGHEQDGDIIEHDRGDQLIGAEAQLEHAGEQRPERTDESRGQDHSRDQQRRGQGGHGEADPGGGRRAEEELPFRAEIERAAAERDRDGEAREGERDGAEQRLAEAVP